MSAETLRKAATILRERVGAATPGGWIPFGNNIGATVDKCTCSPIHDTYEMHEGFCGIEGPIVQACDTDAAYIATMHPGVGLALADWLDAIAAGWPWDGEEPGVVDWDGDRLLLANSLDSHALTLARLIVGEQS